MAHLGDTHAAAVPVQHLLSGLQQHLFGQHGGAGAEVESSGHCYISVLVAIKPRMHANKRQYLIVLTSYIQQLEPPRRKGRQEKTPR
jgi:hypothetical protein